MTAAYPLNDGSNATDAINYLLSGPSGTGQNFAGNSSIEINVLRPSYGFDPFYGQPPGGAPFIRPVFNTLNSWLFYAKAINNAVIVGSNPTKQVTFTFTTPFATAPFALGDQLYVIGITPTDYNGYWTVFSSTTTQMVCFREEAQTYPAFVSSVGGMIRDFRNVQQITDMQAEVTVTGGSDRVIVSSQADILFAWFGAPSTFRFDILVQVLRFKKQGPESPQPYVLDGVVIQRNYGLSNTSFPTTGDSTVIPAFTSFIDGPNLDIGTYNYALAVTFVTDPSIDLYGENGYLSTGYGSLLNNQFTGQGTMNQSVSPGTTFTGISPTVTAYDGTASSSTATLNITLYPDITIPSYSIGSNTSVVVTTQSNDFHLNDTLKILGTSLGGTSPLNDLTLTVTKIAYPGSPTISGTLYPKDMILELRSLTAQVVKE